MDYDEDTNHAQWDQYDEYGEYATEKMLDDLERAHDMNQEVV